MVGVFIGPHHHIVNLPDILQWLCTLPIIILVYKLVVVGAVEIVVTIDIEIELAVSVSCHPCIGYRFLIVLGSGLGGIGWSICRETELEMCTFEI